MHLANQIKNIKYDIFKTLLNTGGGWVTGMDYYVAILGYHSNIQNRAMPFLLGVNKFTPTHALYGELGWVIPRKRRWLSLHNSEIS